MNVDINNNQAFNAQNLNANSTNDSNIVNVTLGLAGSNKSFSGAGSFGVSDIVNDGTINIKNSNVTATDNFQSEAQSNAHIVNVAGQAALADEFAGGLTFAYAIDQDKTTGNANVTINAASGKNTPDKLTFENNDEKKSSIDVDNKINTAAAVLDLNFSSNSWVNGAVAVAVNKFNQSTEANLKGRGEKGEVLKLSATSATST